MTSGTYNLPMPRQPSGRAVRPRPQGLRSNGEGKPVVAVDIDGTIADYHSWFLMFARLYFGRDLPQAHENNPGLPLYKFMGVTKAQYRECKLAYRQGGMKRSMPVLPGASELVRRIRGTGAEVWICTTRPYLRLDNIDPDTREWLRRNDIKYDALLFDGTGGDSKYRELARQAGGRVVCALEDLPEQAERAAKVGIQYVFLRDQPYNRHYKINEQWRWARAEQAWDLVSLAIADWKRRRGYGE